MPASQFLLKRTLSPAPGEQPLPGLTDEEKPRMRGPKRASKIRKLFNLSKDDDVRKYVNTYRTVKTSANGKTHSKAPKIQRLVTPQVLQRKRHRAAIKRNRIIRVRPRPKHPPPPGFRARHSAAYRGTGHRALHCAQRIAPLLQGCWVSS
jgi:hypothetical protein